MRHFLKTLQPSWAKKALPEWTAPVEAV